MPTPSNPYMPPPSADMASRQNRPNAVRLLLAQRHLYSRSKVFLAIRWFGMVVIGLGAPFVSVVRPEFAVTAGAIAGAWLFLGRTLLIYLQQRIARQAAAIQEQFDFYVFGMPSSIDRSSLPSREDIERIVGPANKLDSGAIKEKLYDWYPIDDSVDALETVAVCQRANVSYADRLLRTTRNFWGIVTTAWLLTLVVASSLIGLPLSTFLVGVMLPVLPAFLDVAQFVLALSRAAQERRDVAQSIERKIRGAARPIETEDLLIWQERIHGLRQVTPDVPNFVYWLGRKSNERAMIAVSRGTYN